MEGQQVQRDSHPDPPPELDHEAEDHADNQHLQQDRGKDKDCDGRDRGHSVGVSPLSYNLSDL